MRFFTRLRTALALAERVEALESTVESLQFDWNDTLDKLLAREERMRKRYKAEVNRAITEPGPVAETGGDVKRALRARITALRAQGQ